MDASTDQRNQKAQSALRNEPVPSNLNSRPRFWVSLRRGPARSAVMSVSFLVVILGLWQLCAAFGWINTAFTSSPADIVTTMYHFLPTSEALTDMRVSGEEFAIGLALSIVVGVTLGLLMGWYRLFEEATALSLNMFYSMPLIAMAPVFVLWFGIGLESKVAIVFLASLFPQILSTLTGVKRVDPALIQLARSYGASRTQLWRTVLLPAAVPYILTGVRLGVVGALVGTVVSEFVASSAGIGYLVLVAGNDFNMSLMFVGLLVIVIVAGVLTFVLQAVERHFDGWRS